MEEEARTWIGLMLGEPFGEGERFSDGLKNGVRLCRLANIVQPGSIPKFSLEPKMAIKERENITLFIQALKRFGIKDFECFSTLDLAEGQNTKAVVVAIHALGRLCQGPEYSAHEDWPKLGKQVLAKNVRGMPRKAASPLAGTCLRSQIPGVCLLTLPGPHLPPLFLPTDSRLY